MADGDPEGDYEARRTRELIGGASDFVGAAAGGAVGLIGGPIGVLGGAATGVAVAKAVNRIGAEIHDRLLGPRQRQRAGLALGTAVTELSQSVDRGVALRDDGFFVTDPGDSRGPGDELLEGVLLRAMNAYQERKVPYLGRFYASVAVRADISPAYAHLLLRLADQMTYRQFVLLAYLSNLQDDGLPNRSEDPDSKGAWYLPDGLGAELKELGDEMGLLGIKRPDAPPIPAGATMGGGDITRHDPKSVTMTDLGRDLHDLLGLAQIPETERRQVQRMLWGGS